MPVALPPEVRHEDRRHEELHQRSAEEADELSEHTEQGMPELVDREVEAVEPAVVAGVENQEPAVQREHGGEGEARGPLQGGGRIGGGFCACWGWRPGSIGGRVVAGFRLMHTFSLATMAPH